MTHAQVRRSVLRNALSGYFRLAVRMGLGLISFRLLYQTLSREEFGFWTLLWAGFGYGILLDFGFGYAAQKRVAELSVRGDWKQLSSVLSTIFTAYLASAVLTAILALGFSGPLIDFFQVSDSNRSSFTRILQIFVIGIGVAFPLGLFPDILRGQQRLTIAYNLGTLSIVANCLVVSISVLLHLPFTVLIVLALLCVLIPYSLAAWLALRHMPEVRISPALFSRRALSETTRFSLYAYLSILGNVVRNKADPPILSSILGVTAVGPYQAGAKVGDIFGMISRQIADVLSPTAAHLHALGDAAGLRQTLIDGLRFSVLAATPLYVVSAAYMEGLIRFITGDPKPETSILWTGQLLLFWYYSLSLTHWVFKRMFFMAGQERRMMWQGVTEAAMNILLSVTLTFTMRSIVGVALGSVIPTLLFGWGQLWGWAAKEAGLSRWALFRRIVLPAWKGCLPMIALAAMLRFQPWWPSGSSTALVLLEGAAVGLTGITGVWQLSLTPGERRRLVGKLDKALRREPQAPRPSEPDLP